jgi:hypothetical protein
MRGGQANPPGFKRIESGCYAKRLQNGMWLYLFKAHGKWHYAKRLSGVYSRKDFSADANPKHQSGFPTRAMALSAYEGNRAR